ncbi:alpha/beta fold hydrolase [Streptomyces otsuchiensis]|uniref:alpha/beta fold hydrolase n=1 Tax=Streptomyces otsuchiensis TaxID=2681388 RepID=UPI001031ED02|nr:alpha/beta hydrolase [Streptomyces otsuchiensis]
MPHHPPAPQPPSGAPAPAPVHRLVESPAGRIHLVEQGEGPLVLLLHGFPEAWFSWRRQLPALAGAGYRAVAVDVRGYGRSSRPADIPAYRMLELVADNVAVVRALGARTATVIGHDWGSPIAANSALLHPETFTAVGLLSVPYSPRGGPRPTELFDRVGGDDEFYVSYFQRPGRAEAEIEPDVRGWLAGLYGALSADTMRAADVPPVHFIPPGARMADRFPAAGTLPAWLSEEELDRYAAEFERTGLTGALNRYRNMDRDWEDLAPWDGAAIHQPSLFIGGNRDASTTWMSEAIDAYPRTLPGLVSSHLLDGCGHWVQQERADEVNALLLEWLDAVTPADTGTS